MGILQRLKNQKENGQGLTILIILNLFFIGLNAYQAYSALSGLTWQFYALAVLNVLSSIVIAATSLNLERKGYSFSAHIIFFILFLKDYLKEFYAHIFTGRNYQLFSYLVLIIGTVTSIYVIAKIIAHSDEIKQKLTYIPRVFKILLIIGLVNLYLNDGFDTMVVFGFVFIAVIATAKAKEVLPIIAALSFRVVFIQIIPSVIFALNQLTLFTYIKLTIGILIELAIIYFTLKLYGSNDNIEHDFIN